MAALSQPPVSRRLRTACTWHIRANPVEESPWQCYERHMEFRILGSLQVCDDGREIPVGGGKQRALLACLLVKPNQPVAEDALIEALWTGRRPAKAVDNLHVLVSRLRKALGSDRIVREGGGYAVRVDDDELDLTRFERLRAEGRPAEALAVWRGAPLVDFTYDDWAQAEIRRLEELRLTVLEQRIEADLEDGKHAELVGELRSLVAEHPLREGLRRQLILALYRSERQAEALAAYRDARRMLDDELGLEPSPALRELEGAVLRHDPSLRRPPKRAAPVGRRRSRIAVVAAVTGFLAALAAIQLVEGDDPQRVAAAAPQPHRLTTPTSTSTTRVIIRELVRPAPPPPKTTVRHPAPPPAADPAPPPAPPPPPPPPPRPQPQPQPPSKPKPKAQPQPRPQPQPAPPQVRITDNFDDGVLDRAVWVRTASSGVTVEERNQRLEMTIAPDALAEGDYKLISGTYGTHCRFLGDFDARVEFELLEWPEANGTIVQLAAWFQSFNAGVVRQSQLWTEEYGSWLTRRARSSPSNDTRGALRLRRVGDAVTTYFRRSADWYPLQTSSGFVGAPLVGIQSMSRDDWFADKPVRIAFDNFSLTAGKRAC